jgi:hypothetical protein
VIGKNRRKDPRKSKIASATKNVAQLFRLFLRQRNDERRPPFLLQMQICQCQSRKIAEYFRHQQGPVKMGDFRHAVTAY